MEAWEGDQTHGDDAVYYASGPQYMPQFIPAVLFNIMIIFLDLDRDDKAILMPELV